MTVNEFAEATGIHYATVRKYLLFQIREKILYKLSKNNGTFIFESFK